MAEGCIVSEIYLYSEQWGWKTLIHMVTCMQQQCGTLPTLNSSVQYRMEVVIVQCSECSLSKETFLILIVIAMDKKRTGHYLVPICKMCQLHMFRSTDTELLSMLMLPVYIFHSSGYAAIIIYIYEWSKDYNGYIYKMNIPQSKKKIQCQRKPVNCCTGGSSVKKKLWENM